jgi:hypothetical protein
MGVADHVLESISGHVSRRMLEHYSHIRIDAKRQALDAGRRSACGDAHRATAKHGFEHCLQRRALSIVAWCDAVNVGVNRRSKTHLHSSYTIPVNGTHRLGSLVDGARYVEKGGQRFGASRMLREGAPGRPATSGGESRSPSADWLHSSRRAPAKGAGQRHESKQPDNRDDHHHDDDIRVVEALVGDDE